MPLKRHLAATFIMVAVGCGNSSGHPDTGAGAHQTPPATENCADVCQRIGDCGVILCNEDTKSTRYDGLASLLLPSCLSTCTDALIMSNISPANWRCMFESSCRQVFEHDACGEAHYNCT